MTFSNFLLTIFSGLAGTLIMTAIMYLYARVSKKDTRVVHVLGTMLTGSSSQVSLESKKVLLTGSMAHLGIGMLFSLMYFLLWNWGVFDITVTDSVIIGALSGGISIIVWRSYFVLHRNPPVLSLFHYFIALFISHIVFGVVTVNMFRLISDDPQFWYRMKQDLSASL
ncbi:hypothetical protein JKA74_03415 [Marivirga sp. S37H4]|uniref:Uncharacterized protein n=1 Tax=Marivirga aurantiaca TaxID=2802615 RepID=A0A934WVZ7_9BACT|nr:hypothetical protein [Marivirga aurantiaca]MBK6264074.1 hypothetical protein [Marivirga aurantiaca]